MRRVSRLIRPSLIYHSGTKGRRKMKTVAKYVVLLVGALLIHGAVHAASPRESSKSATAGPSFPQSMLYRDVRSKLMEMGWRPLKLPSAAGCTWDNCKDFPETLVCYGVGRAPCLYTWERNSIQMIVTAVGEGDQTFAGTKICKKIGQIPPPVGGWGCI